MALRLIDDSWQGIDLLVCWSYPTTLRLHFTLPSNYERDGILGQEGAHFGLPRAPIQLWKRWAMPDLLNSCRTLHGPRSRRRDARNEGYVARACPWQHRWGRQNCSNWLDYATIPLYGPSKRPCEQTLRVGNQDGRPNPRRWRWLRGAHSGHFLIEQYKFFHLLCLQRNSTFTINSHNN